VNPSLALSLRNVYETLAISAPTVVDAVLGRVRKDECDARLDRWSKACLRNAQIELDVSGAERLATHETYLVMSNHQSLYDIPVLFQVVGPNIRMITKKELFRVPVFGGALDAAGFISIDRTDRNAAIRSLHKACDLLASGTHVWIAPEGTRSKTGSLLPFKKGAFYLAFEAGLPILPVSLDGTRQVLPAHGFLSRPGARVRVTIHDVVDPKPFVARGKPGRSELTEYVRQIVGSAL
jgi:1-acyl-sn-glycerol-3-phosphate acyltransferase